MPFVPETCASGKAEDREVSMETKGRCSFKNVFHNSLVASEIQHFSPSFQVVRISTQISMNQSPSTRDMTLHKQSKSRNSWSCQVTSPTRQVLMGIVEPVSLQVRCLHSPRQDKAQLNKSPKSWAVSAFTAGCEVWFPKGYSGKHSEIVLASGNETDIQITFCKNVNTWAQGWG